MHEFDLHSVGFSMQAIEQKANQQAAEVVAQKEVEATDDEVKLLEEEIKLGLRPRSSQGQAFSRSADGGKSDEYAALASHGEKRSFRQRWGETRLQVLIETKTKSEQLEKKVVESGKYLPFDIIVDKEGGAHRPAAVKAAGLYIRKCLRMSRQWVQWNGMTERFEFLYIRKEHIEVFSRCWALHTTTTTTTQPKPTLAGNNAGTTTGAQDINTKPSKTNGKTNAGGEAREQDHGQKDKPKQETSIDKALRRARKTKQVYEQVTSRAASLRAAISLKSEWQYANDEKSLKGLVSAISQMQTDTSDFAIDFLTSDIKDVRLKYKASVVEAECINMANTMDPNLKRIDTETKVLLSMHAARAKAFSA